MKKREKEREEKEEKGRGDQPLIKKEKKVKNTRGWKGSPGGKGKVGEEREGGKGVRNENKCPLPLAGWILSGFKQSLSFLSPLLLRGDIYSLANLKHWISVLYRTKSQEMSLGDNHVNHHHHRNEALSSTRRTNFLSNRV